MLALLAGALVKQISANPYYVRINLTEVSVESLEQEVYPL